MMNGKLVLKDLIKMNIIQQYFKKNLLWNEKQRCRKKSDVEMSNKIEDK